VIVEVVPGNQLETIGMRTDLADDLWFAAPNTFQHAAPQQLLVLFWRGFGVNPRNKYNIHCFQLN